jgi:hypothetical protein
MLVAAACDEVDAQFAVEPFAQLFGREIQLGRRQHRTLDVVRALIVAIGGLAPELLGGLEHAVAEHEQRIDGEIVEQGFGLREEQRQVILDPGRRRSFPDVLVQRAAPDIDRKAFAQPRAEALGRFVGERKFAPGQQAHRIDFVQRALGFRIEIADRFDFLVEQFDAIRLGRAHGIDVDERAAHGEIAWFEHLRHMAVAGRLEAPLLRAEFELLADLQREPGAADVTARREALHQRRDRHHQQTAGQRRQAVQRRDALRHDFRVRREQVIRQGFPVGKVQHFGGAAGEAG